MQEFSDYVHQLPADRLWVKYQPEKKAYAIGRDFFLEHKEYTHLVILPDDLFVEPQHFVKLAKTAEQYQVLAGACNVNTWDQKEQLAATLDEIPSLRREMREYQFVHRDDAPKLGIRQTAFNGFACMFIRREVVEQIPFQDDCIAQGIVGTGGAVDLMFCFDCRRKGIPIYTDFSVIMEHRPGNRNLQVGIKEPRYYLEKFSSPVEAESRS